MEFEKDSRAEREKKKNNHCKCTLRFLCLNKLFTQMHISPDVVYLYAGGTVSTCKEARKIKMSGTVFRQRQQFFQTVEVNVPPF